jgi:hypothetical protein
MRCPLQSLLSNCLEGAVGQIRPFGVEGLFASELLPMLQPSFLNYEMLGPTQLATLKYHDASADVMTVRCMNDERLVGQSTAVYLSRGINIYNEVPSATR